MPSWIDFKELRSKLKFEDVLRHYGVDVKRRGEQHLGYCPLPNHNGKRNSQSFSANLERGIFHCFGCQAKGNVLDFAVLMRGEPHTDGRSLKKVALELRDIFCPEDGKQPPKPRKEAKPTTPEPEQLSLGVRINEPLDFELKGLDSSHPFLLKRRLVSESIAQFGLGYCARGSLAGRIAIPLHDSEGRLIGYAGRVVDDAAITEDNPRYRLPSKREREGIVLEFRKSLFLYNGHRLKQCDDLFVVEGFASVWWLTQNGYGATVSTMGAECSNEQAELIVSKVSSGGHVWIMPDDDKAGERFAASLLLKISPHRYVRWAKLQDGKQPTDLSAEELNICLSE